MITVAAVILTSILVFGAALLTIKCFLDDLRDDLESE